MAEALERIGGVVPERWLAPLTGPALGVSPACAARLQVRGQEGQGIRRLPRARQPAARRPRELRSARSSGSARSLRRWRNSSGRSKFAAACRRSRWRSGTRRRPWCCGCSMTRTSATSALMREFEPLTASRSTCSAGARYGPGAIAARDAAALPHSAGPRLELEFAHGLRADERPVNRPLVERAGSSVPGPRSRVLDLFCGLGNFCSASRVAPRSWSGSRGRQRSSRARVTMRHAMASQCDVSCRETWSHRSTADARWCAPSFSPYCSTRRAQARVRSCRWWPV